MTHPTIRRINAGLVTEQGWRTGTDLEDRVAYRLIRWGWSLGDVKQQHPVARYRIDFAWPRVKVALEVDGWWHRSPEGAEKDARRDAHLRALGWLVLRIDDQSDVEEQLARVVSVVNALMDQQRLERLP